jgi:carboxyl-terminal processing protease
MMNILVRHVSLRPYRWHSRMLLCGAGLLALLVTSASFAQSLKEPRRDDQIICSAAIQLVQSEHLLKKELGDDVSQRAFKSFLAQLDPMKMYFQRSDIDTFSGSENQLDDMVKRGDVSFAYDVYRRYLERVSQRASLVRELLQPTLRYDFTTDDQFISNPEALDYPKTDAEARERWRLSLKYQLLQLKTAEGDLRLDGFAARAKLVKRYESYLNRVRSYDADELLEIFLSAFFGAYEDGTFLQSPSSLTNERIQFGKQLEGIGAAIRTEDGVHLIASVVTGGPAARDGRLKPLDQIVSVGQGDNGEMVDVRDLPLEKMIQLIRGAANSVVRVGVIPRGTQQLAIYRIVRGKIDAIDSFARSQITDEIRKSDGKRVRIGTIVLPSFYRDFEQFSAGNANARSATRDVKLILQDFVQRGVDAVVFDLRDNGGGALAESISLTGLFIDKGPVLQVRGRDGQVQSYHDQESGAVWQKPLVVLVNSQTASASEIFAGAIQDYGRGLVVGDESTFGKGTVQTIRELGPEIFKIANPPNMGALRLTIQQFYRASGASVQSRGIQTDIILPSPTGQSKKSWENRSNTIAFDRIDSVPCVNYGLVNSKTMQSVRAQSLARRESSSAFIELVRLAERVREESTRIVISLQEEQFRKRQAATRPINSSNTTTREAGEALVRDFYLDEVYAITADYVAEVGGGASPQFASTPNGAATTVFKPVVPATPPSSPASSPAVAPVPRVDPNQQNILRRQQILRDLLEVERNIERTQEDIRRLQQEIAFFEQRINDAGRVIRNAENNTQGFLGGFAGGYFITQKLQAEQRLSSSRSALEAYRNQRLRLQQEQIGLGQ